MTTKPPSATGLSVDASAADSIEDLLMPMTKAPHPLSSAATPGPVIKTPGPLETPAPALKTPAPTLKTPAPVAAANRDPNSALPTIPPPKKEPSGASRCRAWRRPTAPSRTT
jgi:hypothetical protein